MTVATEHERFYAELVARNRGLIAPEDQRRLRETRFVIAGCGSTGGACVMPLVRSGAERFLLLEPGSYELNNLNRQDATTADVGRNKAVVQAERVRAVNPFAEVEVREEGVDPVSIGDLLHEKDLVIDAVDVTTVEGVRAKMALHEAALPWRLIVVTAYDVGTTQFVDVLDYRRERRALRGRASADATPDRFLRAVVPPLVVPRSLFAELLARRDDPERPFPQLAMTSTMLGALIVPGVVRLLGGRPTRSRLHLDVEDVWRPFGGRWVERARRAVGLARVWWRLR